MSETRTLLQIAQLHIVPFRKAYEQKMAVLNEWCILLGDKPLLHPLENVYEHRYPFSSLKRMRELRRKGEYGQWIDYVRQYSVKEDGVKTYFYLKCNQLKVVYIEYNETKYFLDKESLIRVAAYKWKDKQQFVITLTDTNHVNIISKKLNYRENRKAKKEQRLATLKQA